VPGFRAVGHGCMYPNDWASGLTCAAETLATIGYVTCRKRCVTAAPECDAEETCVERAPGDGYGVCLPM
jgi:hypothetical protein